MNIKPRSHFAAVRLISAALLLSQIPLLAQTAPAANNAPAPRDSNFKPEAGQTNPGDTVELSPFVVKGGQDTGYQANDTLAGTRLRTPLKDIAASISVVTPQFMEDTGSYNLKDLLIYTTGTEVSGIGGNLSGNAAGSNFNSDDARNNPNPSTRVRGVAAADLTRNYFATIVPMDAYNSSGVTINRGANAILFGLGSPAGIIEMSTNLPQFRNHSRVSLNGDMWGSFRQSLDAERVLIDKKLSLRVDAMNSDSKFEQDFSYQKSRRYYAALEYRPFKSTTFRINAENGSQDQRLPRPNPPVDGITSWYTYGQQSRPDNIYTPTGTAARGAFERLNNLDAALGFGTGLSVPSIFFSDPGNTSSSGILAAMPEWSGNIVVPGQGTYIYRMMGVRQTTDARNFALANPPTNGVQDPVLNNGFSFNNMMLDRSVFDYRKHALYGPNDYSKIKFDTFNASAEQLFLGGDAGLELVYDQQKTRQTTFNNFVGNRGDSIGIDINQQLTNGQPNPNFGRIVVSSVGSARILWQENYTYRGTAFLKHDFRDNFNHNWLSKLLGKQSLTGFYTDNLTKVYNVAAYNAVAAPSYVGAGTTNAIGNRQLNAVVYIGPSLLGTTTPAGANATGVQSTIEWPSTLTSYTIGPDTNYLWAPRTDSTYVFNDDGTNLEWLANGISATRQQNTSYGGVLQSYWLDGLFVSTLGMRHDHVQNYAGSVATFDPITGARLLVKPHTVAQLGHTGTTFTQGYALHMPRRWVSKLPWHIDPSLYYNDSENFRLTAARVDIYNHPFEPEEGSTKEWGIGVNALDGKLSFRVTHYNTVQENVTDSRILASSNLLTAVAEAEKIIINGLTPTQIAASGYKGFDSLSSTSQEFQDYMNTWNFRITGTRPDGTRDVAYTAPVGVADVTGAQSKGWEFEATYNPLPNWRISANAAKQGAVRGVTAPNEDKLFEYAFAQWQNPALLQAAALTTLPSFVVLRTQHYISDQSSENQPVQELVKWRANVVTNYDFKQSSRLNGFGIGGAASWQQGIVTGYPIITSPEDAKLLIRDTDHAFHGKDIIRYDGWISYSREIWNNKVKWKVQLNIRNLLDTDKMITTAENAVTVNDTKTKVLAHQVIGIPRTWSLTSSFDF